MKKVIVGAPIKFIQIKVKVCNLCVAVSAGEKSKATHTSPSFFVPSSKSSNSLVGPVSLSFFHLYPFSTLMPTLLSISQNEPFPMSTMTDGQQPTSYKEIIKQLAAQAPKPYGAIPPLLKKRKKKSSKHRSRRKSPDPEDEPQQIKPMRRMSHVEDWIVVDSKESLPDEEELVRDNNISLLVSMLLIQ